MSGILSTNNKQETSALAINVHTFFVKNYTQPVLVDAEDWCGVRMFTWRSNNTYICTKLSAHAPEIRLHRFVLHKTSLPDGYVVDHINGNTFDNRKCNLRIVTHADNCRNRAPIDAHTGLPRGVTQRNGRYRARVMYNYTNHWLGTFDTIEAAMYARQQFMKEHEDAVG